MQALEDWDEPITPFLESAREDETRPDESSKPQVSADDEPSQLLSGVSEEEMRCDWVSKEKHMFVLSSAGKPIYTRHGDESKLSSLMGVIQAIISFIKDAGDELRTA
mmetsp:Transcript_53083/g.88242  ORF Transcript_53083/g.88242 Transcript_53083/m.88242 type:complete len:107 (+) Transcript_53083:80-400(+)